MQHWARIEEALGWVTLCMAHHWRDSTADDDGTYFPPRKSGIVISNHLLLCGINL